MQEVDSDVDLFHDFLRAHPRVVVLTGAGVSCASGIPAYRDAKGGWMHSTPIQHRDFIQRVEQRQRYWTRSFSGWPLIQDAQPNAAHVALAALERSGIVSLIITQNVDRLHQRAGSQRVIDLHGRLDRVRCLQCQRFFARVQMQQRLSAMNPDLELTPHGQTRPDGDVEVAGRQLTALQVPSCNQCAGTLMPDVVFYGGTVPADRVAQGMAAITEADALVAIGTSLQVYSGFRFCRAALSQGKPVALINPGVTRADEIASLKLSSPCGELLERVASDY